MLLKVENCNILYLTKEISIKLLLKIYLRMLASEVQFLQIKFTACVFLSKQFN